VKLKRIFGFVTSDYLQQGIDNLINIGEEKRSVDASGGTGFRNCGFENEVFFN
jgi:hypothetical protein